jgi:hypothetical protein
MEEVFALSRSQKGSRKPWQSLVGLCGVFTMNLALMAPAQAGSFTGSYDISNWTIIDTTGDGSVITPDLGLSIIITGGNNGSGLPGMTDFVISAPASGLVQFNWSYSSLDLDFACGVSFTLPCDDGGYLLNGAYTELADAANQGSGSASFSVTAGEIFGFQVDTGDNTGEPGMLTISSFDAPVGADAPEPGTVSVVLGLGAMMAAVRWRKRRTSPLR